jgi:hypothetical protein
MSNYLKRKNSVIQLIKKTPLHEIREISYTSFDKNKSNLTL